MSRDENMKEIGSRERNESKQEDRVGKKKRRVTVHTCI